MPSLGGLDIILHKKDNLFSQCKYLIHGYDDVFWTDDLDEALGILKSQLLLMEEKTK